MFQLYSAAGPIAAIPDPTAVTVGVFDGVHRGHRHLIHQLATLDRSLSPLVVTLSAHPSFVLGLNPNDPWLDDPDEHLRLLFEAGASYVAVMPFTADVARMTACGMAQMMFDQLNMRSLLLGYDSRFGSKQGDDFSHLPQLASQLGFDYRHADPFLVDGNPVSSSRIRNTLISGDVSMAARLLGCSAYAVRGVVVHGRGVGRSLGFPTANVDTSASRKMMPGEGVYQVSLTVAADPVGSSSVATAIGIANLGAAPTFGIQRPTLEVHLIDFSGDLYGSQVEVRFLRRLRDTVRFDTPEALQVQLQHDLEQARLWS